MDVKEKIQQFIEYKGINISAFEKSISCSNGYWRKTKSISANVLSDIVRIYSELSADWILRDEGEMLKENLNPQQQPTLDKGFLLFLESKDKEIKELKEALESKNKELMAMSKEIGSLESEVTHLRTRKGVGRQDVEVAEVADVG